MVTDRKIIAGNGKSSLDLTGDPYTVKNIRGFDRLTVQNVTSQGFDQDGASLLNSYVLPRDMEISGQIRAESTVRMQTLRDKMFNIFTPKTDVTITHYYGGVNRVITARVQKSPKFDFTNVQTVQNYSVELTASDPYWRDETETLVKIADIKGSFHFPLVIPKGKGVRFGIKSSSLIANVFNRSGIKVGMKFMFVANGEVTNPQLFHINTRKYFRLLCHMEAGERITVETGQENTVTRNQNGLTEDYIGKIDLAGGGDSFLQLEPGDNLLRYAADDGESMLETRIYFQNKYTGV